MLENLKILPEYDGFLFLAESVRNPPLLRPHHHEELELNIIINGSITYVVGNNRFTFKKQNMLWFMPNQEHQLVNRSDNARYYVAVFKQDLINDACKGKKYEWLKTQEFNSSDIRHTLLPANKFHNVKQEMESITTEGIDPDILNRESGFGVSEGFHFQHNDPDWLNAGLRHLLLMCCRLQDEYTVLNNTNKLHPSVVKVLELMSQGNMLSLEALARECTISPAYLSRLFRKEIGISLTRYRNSVRLGMFWEAYRNPTTFTALEAVYRAGFGSYSQFFRVFKQTYGVSPRSFLTKTNQPHDLTDSVNLPELLHKKS